MFDGKEAKKVTVHVGEDHVYRGKSVFLAVLDHLRRRKIPTANVIRGIAGFGADHHMHTINIERLTENLPIQIEFVAPSDTVDEVLSELCEMVGTGLIEVQDTILPISAAPPNEKLLSPKKTEGKEKLLRIFVSESDKSEGKPLLEAVLESMRATDIAGVTVYRGVAGFGESGKVQHGQPPISASPLTIVAIDAEEKIQAFLPVLDRVLSTGLVVLSEVETVRYRHDFRNAERRSRVR